MRVDGFCHASPGVTQYHFDAGVIDPGGVEQAGQRMTALVGRVLHSDGVHGFIPEPTEAVVGGAWADCPGCFTLREHVQDAMMDGDFTNPGGCL